MPIMVNITQNARGLAAFNLILVNTERLAGAAWHYDCQCLGTAGAISAN
jgi:hypothetical protein